MNVIWFGGPGANVWHIQHSQLGSDPRIRFTNCRRRFVLGDVASPATLGHPRCVACEWAS